MISAAMSMSRMAIHARPVALRTRFFASRVRTTTTPSVTRYLTSDVAWGPETTTLIGARKSNGPPASASRPNSVVVGAEATPAGS